MLTPELEAWILEATRRAPNNAATHWSTRKLGAHLDVSHMMVTRVWRKHGLKPPPIERYMASNDLDFETKAAEVTGLYLYPPANAAVLCVDEKAALRPWIVRIRRCRCLRDAQNGTVLSTTGKAPWRCTPLSMRIPAKSWARPQSATPRRSSSPFSLTS